MKKLSEYLLLWTLGGCLYYFFEIFFRGFSHWSMFVLGGICMVFFTVQGQMGGPAVDADIAVHYFCDGHGIYDGDYRQ